MAAPAPAKQLQLAPDRHLCVSPKTAGDRLALPDGASETAARAAYQRITREFQKRGWDSDRVIYTDNPVACDPVRGDLVLRNALQVDRAQDSFVLTVTAGEGPAQWRQSLRRADVTAWGAKHVLSVDPVATSKDPWPTYLAAAVRVDSAGLAGAFLESLQVK